MELLRSRLFSLPQTINLHCMELASGYYGVFGIYKRSFAPRPSPTHFHNLKLTEFRHCDTCELGRRPSPTSSKCNKTPRDLQHQPAIFEVRILSARSAHLEHHLSRPVAAGVHLAVAPGGHQLWHAVIVDVETLQRHRRVLRLPAKRRERLVLNVCQKWDSNPRLENQTAT